MQNSPVAGRTVSPLSGPFNSVQGYTALIIEVKYKQSSFGKATWKIDGGNVTTLLNSHSVRHVRKM